MPGLWFRDSIFRPERPQNGFQVQMKVCVAGLFLISSPLWKCRATEPADCPRWRQEYLTLCPPGAIHFTHLVKKPLQKQIPHAWPLVASVFGVKDWRAAGSAIVKMEVQCSSLTCNIRNFPTMWHHNLDSSNSENYDLNFFFLSPLIKPVSELSRSCQHQHNQSKWRITTFCCSCACNRCAICCVVLVVVYLFRASLRFAKKVNVKGTVLWAREEMFFRISDSSLYML